MFSSLSTPGVSLRRADADDSTIERLTALRQRIHDQVCREGWNEGLGTFTQYFGGQEIDASLLLLPVVGFLPATDPRMAATIETIRRELTEGGLVRRMKAKPGKTAEGAFLACTFWAVEALAFTRRPDEAHALYDAALAALEGHPLLAEMVDPATGEMLGNLPQALSHLALINAASALVEAREQG